MEAVFLINNNKDSSNSRCSSAPLGACVDPTGVSMIANHPETQTKRLLSLMCVTSDQLQNTGVKNQTVKVLTVEIHSHQRRFASTQC